MRKWYDATGHRDIRERTDLQRDISGIAEVTLEENVTVGYWKGVKETVVAITVGG